MATTFKLIQAPTDNTIMMLMQRMNKEEQQHITGKHWDAVLLVQTNLPEMYALADTAEKTANVIIEEIKGVCPQHVGMIAVFGSTSAIQSVIDAMQ
jgi:hypothetical protein